MVTKAAQLRLWTASRPVLPSPPLTTTFLPSRAADAPQARTKIGDHKHDRVLLNVCVKIVLGEAGGVRARSHGHEERVLGATDDERPKQAVDILFESVAMVEVGPA